MNDENIHVNDLSRTISRDVDVKAATILNVKTTMLQQNDPNHSNIHRGLHARSQDGMILKLAGQADLRRQQLLKAQEKATDESNRLIEEIKGKAVVISNLENEVKLLKDKIKGTEGKNSLLQYRLQKSLDLLNKYRNEDTKFSNSNVNSPFQPKIDPSTHQAMLLHYSKLQPILQSIQNISNEIISPGNEKSVERSDFTELTDTAIYGDIIESKSLSNALLFDEDSLRTKLAIQLRLNERLKAQLRDWVEKQIDLHTHLAEQEIFHAKDKDLNTQHEYSEGQTSASSSTIFPELISPCSPNLEYQSIKSFKSPTPSENSRKSTSPQDLKALFAGLDGDDLQFTKFPDIDPRSNLTDSDKNDDKNYPYKLIQQSPFSPNSVHPMLATRDLTPEDSPVSLACGDFVLEYQDVDDRTGANKIPAVNEEDHLHVYKRSSLMSPSTASIVASTLSPNSFQQHMRRIRSGNTMIQDDIQRFKSNLQKFKGNTASMSLRPNKYQVLSNVV